MSPAELSSTLDGDAARELSGPIENDDQLCCGTTPSCAKTRPSWHRQKNCASRNQAKTLAREQVTPRPPTLDCGNRAKGRRLYNRLARGCGSGSRAGVQLPRCAARGLRRVYREPQGRGLGAAANRLRGRRDLGRNPGAPGSEHNGSPLAGSRSHPAAGG